MDLREKIASMDSSGHGESELVINSDSSCVFVIVDQQVLV